MNFIFFIAAFSLLVSFVFCVPLVALTDYTFEMFENDFLRVYDDSERSFRKSLFESRLADAVAHNADSTKSWKIGINKFSDRTEAELNKLSGYSKGMKASKSAANQFFSGAVPISSLPTTVDWRNANIVTEVKDQGHCGSCWAFAATATIESHWALKTGKLSTLSEQNILDCTKNPRHCGGTGGCQGGTAEIAFESIRTLGGIASQWTYPYDSYDGVDKTCRFDPSKKTPVVANVTGFVKLPNNDYEALMTAVAAHGPIAINVAATSAWHSYESGVFDGCNQTNPVLNHVVQLVGYGTDAQLGDYWLVRNSWTPGWGEKGYMRMRRASNEATRCAYDTSPEQGVGCQGEPAEYVCGTCGILYDSAFPTVN